MPISLDSIFKLRQLPAFREYAREKMTADREFWHREASCGTGILHTVAQAVVEIGGDV